MKEGDVDKRGLNPNPKKINNENVVEHVESFHPTISHYRREHTPNVRYLSSDIAVRAMYSDYCETHCTDQEKLISYEYYHEVSFETVTFKYLQVDHTFMAADEFHHRVEMAMKNKKRIYDF
ncbi:unnamed protein product [Parnassius apollo]|uniref:(apollo) hypothetical protein n=1 Tax=Parnassius apollo TaxID=110799 RepID=A0A8S3X4I8_PARAO|nr:unnamed protein product [Parnassius apollo]